MLVVIPWFNHYLDSARRPAREVRALEIGYDLVHTTNSTNLVGTSPQFWSDLANFSPIWREIEQPTPGDRGDCIRMILTNPRDQTLHMQLREEGEYGKFKSRLLSYRITTETNVVKLIQPIHSETNPASTK